MKKKIKKIICCCLTLVLTCVLSTPSYALEKAENKIVVVDNHVPVKDFIANKKEEVRISKEEISPGVTRKTEDKIQSIDVEGNAKIETHVTEIAYEVEPDIIEKNIVIEQNQNVISTVLGANVVYAQTGSNYVEEDACGWKILCYSTIEWKSKVVNGNTYVGITKAYGGVKSLNGYTGANQGGGVTLKEGNVVITQNGIGETSVSKNQTKTIATPAKPHTWSFTPPSSWQYIYTATMGIVSLSETVNYTASNGVTYSLAFPNTLVLDGSII